MAPRPPKITPRWFPKGTPKRSKIHAFFGNVFYMIFDRFWKQFGSQNASKIEQRWAKYSTSLCTDFGDVFWWMLERCFNGLGVEDNLADGTNPMALPIRNTHFRFSDLVLLGWFVDWFSIDFCLIFGSKIDQKSSENRSKSLCETTLIFWCTSDPFKMPTWLQNTTRFAPRCRTKSLMEGTTLTTAAKMQPRWTKIGHQGHWKEGRPSSTPPFLRSWRRRGR